MALERYFFFPSPRARSLVRSPSALGLGRAALALGLALCILPGCRLFMKGEELSTAKDTEIGTWDEAAVDRALGDKSLAARKSMLDFHNSVGAVYIGRIESRMDLVRPDAPDEQRSLASDFHEFLTPEAMGQLRTQLTSALEGKSDGAFTFAGCNDHPWQPKLGKFLSQNLTKILTSDYATYLEPETPASESKAAEECGGLVKAPETGRAMNVEFLVDLVDGKAYQFVHVWPFQKIVDVSLAPAERPARVFDGESGQPRLEVKAVKGALFRARDPLPDNALVVTRPHTGSKRLLVQLLPSHSPFSATAALKARELLGFNVAGIAQPDPSSLADLSRQWFAGQFHARTTQVVIKGAQATMVVASAGNLIGAMGALQAAVSGGTAVTGWEIATLLTQLGATGFGLAGDIVDLANVEQAVELMDHGPQRKALETSLLLVTALGAGFNVADFAIKNASIVEHAFQVYWDSKVLAQHARTANRAGVLQLTLEEFEILRLATNDIRTAEWEVLQAAMARSQTYNAEQIAAFAKLSDMGLVRLANIFKTLAPHAPKLREKLAKLREKKSDADANKLTPGHYGCQAFGPAFTFLGSNVPMVNWINCGNFWMPYRAEHIMGVKLPEGFSGAALRDAHRACVDASKQKKGAEDCRNRQLYCLTVAWAPEFYECVARRNGADNCIMKVCDAPPALDD